MSAPFQNINSKCIYVSYINAFNTIVTSGKGKCNISMEPFQSLPQRKIAVGAPRCLPHTTTLECPLDRQVLHLAS
jgi:hypothetical protein